MKLNKSTYFSLFFLFCFLTSFSVNTYKSINTITTKSFIKSDKTFFFSKKPVNQAASADLLIEENETENENDFHAQIFVLPFFITHFQYASFYPKLLSEKPFTEKLTNPIYIEVCNFKI
jgi:hypothetical protein